MAKLDLITLINNINGVAYRCLNDIHWTMEYMSPSVSSLTGYLSKELTNNRNLSYADLIVDEDKALVWNAVQKGIEKKEAFQIEYRIRQKDGAIRYVWEQGIGVYDDNDQLLALEGYIADITEKKRHEESLEKAIEEKVQEIEKKNTELIKQERTKFLNLMITGLSHQLRNPLNLAMNAEIIISKLISDKSFEVSELKTLLGIIEKNHLRLEEIVNSIFFLLKGENDNKNFHNLKELCSKAISLSAIGDSDLSEMVSIEIGDDTLEINCFPGSFIQFLLIILLNSLIAVKKKNYIKTQRPAIIIKFELAPKPRLIIWDNGIGIKKEELDKVTNPFFTTESIGAKGLGLTFAQEIMNTHEFSMSFSSQENEFFEVLVEFPEQSWRFK